jgi:NAD(P)H-flavin reductase/ferredoxin/fatty-acid desaturase
MATSNSSSVTVNGHTFSVDKRQTILQGALKAGLPFPYNCRVGGCGTCKCQVTRGQVKELTESGYLLSAEELAQGHVLACQSVPVGDIELALPSGALPSTVRGEVVGQVSLTHDIVRFEVKLAEAMTWKAGQYALLTVDGIEGTRSYSFASPPSSDGIARFFVRRVPGGALSPALVDSKLIGRSVKVQGPMGDFTLRSSDSPVLLVAGGSGLAPIMAQIQQMEAQASRREVTLLFGARTQRDLYEVEAIEAVARRWPTRFTFVPVLSEEPADSGWAGARGLVTEHVAANVTSLHQAYLCGPPKMVDAAQSALVAHGIRAEQVFADRFTTLADANQAVADARPVAGFWHYAKFALLHVVGLFSAAALLAGGIGPTIGLLVVVATYIVGDHFSGEDVTTPKYNRPGVLTALLWAALPVVAFVLFCSVWSVSAGDPLGFGAALSSLTGYDFLGARAATGLGHHYSGFVLTGLVIGLVGTVTGHELIHRTWDASSLLVGRWLMAFSLDSIFSIEHVYGHHRYVSTVDDPATAPRGRNVYAHIVISFIKGNQSAWVIEKARLVKRGKSLWSWHNSVLRSYSMSGVILAASIAMGGAVGGAWFLVCALWGKALLEIVNYMEHYGMVREVHATVEPRHSWNTNKRLSSWSMFNLSRHSHHHAQGEVPYHELKPYPEAPVMVSGYLTTLVLALIPPLWHRLMTPKVLAWDETYATPEERKLADEANARSGIAAFQAAAGRTLPAHDAWRVASMKG